MKKFFLLVVVFYSTIDAVNIPNKFDDISNLSNKLFLSVLDQTVEVKSDSYATLPTSISLFSADAKFDGEHLKFCELGNGLYGVPVPAYALLNNQKAVLYPPYWEFLWLYASQFNIPVWCITYKKRNVAYKTLQRLGGKAFDDIEEFEKYLKTNYPEEILIKEIPNKIENFTGILAYAGSRISNDKLEEFKARHPGILFVNDFSALYQRRKDKIHEIFNDNFLSQFRPRWGVYPARYSSNLVEQIKHEIRSKLYIIKPIVGRQARGVMLVDEKNLDSILKSILKSNKSNKFKNKNNKKKSHSFDWQDYEYDNFIVEEFVESKQVFKDNQPYDPTLRLGLILSQDKGKISVNVITAFWKFPPKSLKDRCDLQEKHVTKPMVGAHDPAQNVDAADMTKIRAILNGMLPELYVKILNISKYE
ncbi:MAG: hypothetical protein WC192_05120 [Candidatus Babeliales bacterium]|jgi:hypothetical protein